VLIALMRRIRDGEFVFPLQVNEPMVLSAGAEARYGVFVQQATESLRPSEGLPEEFYLDLATGSVHEGRMPKTMRAALQGAPGKPAKEGKAAVKKPSARTRRRSLRSAVGWLVHGRPAEDRKV
jgi:hypothetical protein